MHRMYILKDKIALPTSDMIAWGLCMDDINGRRVGRYDSNGTRVSTVFLALDHGYNGCVLLFETLVMGGEHDGAIFRCETWTEAEAMHKGAIEFAHGRASHDDVYAAIKRCDQPSLKA